MTPIRLLGLAITLFGVACTTVLPASWERIQPGMLKQGVLKIVGEPIRRTYDGDAHKGTGETWYYDYRDPHTHRFEPKWVKFKDERVVSADDDPARVEEFKKTQAQTAVAEKAAGNPIIPADVGFQCEQNSQCQSGKCLKHKCVGNDDCTGIPGSSCMSNLDCCSRRCNMGARQCY